MVRLLGLAVIGILLGLVTVVGGPLGLVLSAIVAVMTFLSSPPNQRGQYTGVLLAAAGVTASVLLGRVVLSGVSDPAVVPGPGTLEMFASALVVSLLGGAVALAGVMRQHKGDV